MAAALRKAKKSGLAIAVSEEVCSAWRGAVCVLMFCGLTLGRQVLVRGNVCYALWMLGLRIQTVE